ncbi:MAG: metallophosphoesterase [Prevotellaceae bacterium]|jgi:exonuclease III/UDP-2,3-diacylglucosamine pyrophosphatase LpxH|nr:metallophosphoesterase [Prevotellaceae bacterium]
MKRIKELLSVLLLLFLALSCSNNGTELKVLQLNIWIQGRNVPNAPEGVVDIIAQTDPDVVFLCELITDTKPPFTNWLIEELAKKGKTYYSDEQQEGVATLSKYPLQKTSLLIPTKERGRVIVKSFIEVNGRTVVLYSTHLDHKHYAPYLPRGYGALTWQKIDAPVTDADSILAANRVSFRDEAIRGFLTDAKQETDQGNIVIIGGDFNEPSHLDWQDDTKDMRDHRGVSINWDVSLMLQHAGFVDTYRRLYPNPVTHPGFTWPAGNEQAELKKLFFTPDADERDRIDFVYYYPQPGATLAGINIVGPVASIDHGKIVADGADDVIIEPEGVWPSDHKGNLVTFRISSDNKVNKPPVKEKLCFAFLTDIHLNKFKHGKDVKGFKQALDRVKDTDAGFIIFGGDLVDINGGGGGNLQRPQADSMFAVFKQTADQAGLKYYPAIGNHDRYFDEAAGFTKGDELFKLHFGQSYYTFEQKGVRFFVLNSVKDGYTINQEQIVWLKSELLHLSLATPVVIVLHVPVYSLYYPVVDGRYVANDVIDNYRELLAVFREHNLKLVLQGHQHLYEEIYSKNVQYITGGAVCASWWGGAYHGTEEGFLLVKIDEADNLSWKYIDYGWTPK